MKAAEYRHQGSRPTRFEGALEDTVVALFRRCPTLCGFAVRESAYLAGVRSAPHHVSGLFVTEISIYPQNDLEAPVEIRNEIVFALTALIDDCPEAGALLRERSFARVYH